MYIAMYAYNYDRPGKAQWHMPWGHICAVVGLTPYDVYVCTRHPGVGNKGAVVQWCRTGALRKETGHEVN